MANSVNTNINSSSSSSSSSSGGGIRRGNQNSHSSDAGEPPKLSDLLQEGWKTFEEVDAATGSTQDECGGGGGVLLKVRRGMAALAEASRMAARLGLFSGEGEGTEEVATGDVKYLLLDALQGALAIKLAGLQDGDGRMEALRSARAHFCAFLRTCRDHGVAPFRMPRRSEAEEGEEGEEEEDSSGGGEGLVAASKTQQQQRQAKIERYRQRKQAEAEIARMRDAVEGGRADDGTVRDFYLQHVRRWLALSLEEVESIDRETALLQGKRRGHDDPPPPCRPAAAGKPFVLARGAAQARVFGAGYPSRPSMTVDDWYERHAERGVLPDRGVSAGRHRSGAEAREEEETKDEQIEDDGGDDDDDDKEALQKARDWDEWKDSHRRGYGNRTNRG